MENKNKAKARKQQYIERNREYVRKWKESHECEICGEARAVCLDFHHSNPNDKSFDISASKSKSIATLHKEICKCIIVCANCHRVIHAEAELSEMERNNEENLPLFK